MGAGRRAVSPDTDETARMYCAGAAAAASFRHSIVPLSPSGGLRTACSYGSDCCSKGAGASCGLLL